MPEITKAKLINALNVLIAHTSNYKPDPELPETAAFARGQKSSLVIIRQMIEEWDDNKR